MAAGEDQPQPVIGDGLCRVGRVGRLLVGSGRGLLVYQEREPAAQPVAAADQVHRASARDQGQPGCWPVRDAAGRPGRQRLAVGVLDAVLGRVQVRVIR